VSRLPAVAFVLLLGALAPALARAADGTDDIGALAAEQLLTCVTPYLQATLGDDQEALLAALADSTAGTGLLARLEDGAPERWRALLDDAGQPLSERLEAAVSLVGMAVSHGDPRQQAVARAYSAYFMSAVTQGQCPAPAALADFVARTPFWPAGAAIPDPSAPPILSAP